MQAVDCGHEADERRIGPAWGLHGIVVHLTCTTVCLKSDYSYRYRVSAQLGLHCIVPEMGPASLYTSHCPNSTVVEPELRDYRTGRMHTTAGAGDAPVRLGSDLSSAQHGAGSVMCKGPGALTCPQRLPVPPAAAACNEPQQAVKLPLAAACHQVQLGVVQDLL